MKIKRHWKDNEEITAKGILQMIGVGILMFLICYFNAKPRQSIEDNSSSVTQTESAR